MLENDASLELAPVEVPPSTDLEDVMTYLERVDANEPESPTQEEDQESVEPSHSSLSSASTVVNDLNDELDLILYEAITEERQWDPPPIQGLAWDEMSSVGVPMWNQPTDGNDVTNAQVLPLSPLNVTASNTDGGKTGSGAGTKFAVVKQSKSRWSAREDDLLTRCVQQYGPKWIEIGEKHFPNRNHEALRKRWKKIKISTAATGPDGQDGSLGVATGSPSHDWTTEEEVLLSNLCSIHGNNWKVIQHYFPERSSEAIRNFWKRRIKSRSPTIDSKSCGLVKSHDILASPDSAVRVVGILEVE
jgi:hypothetical protein